MAYFNRPMRSLRGWIFSQVVGAVVLGFSASGQSVNWGNSSSLSAIHFDSSGNETWTDAGYTFAFGVFDGGFDPCLELPEDWSSNWTTLDEASYNESTSLFQDSFVISDNFYQGRQAFMWIYNNMAADETSEWALVSNDSWVIPEHAPADHPTPLLWRISDVNEVKFGGAIDSQGPGEFDTDPGTFELQSHTFPPPVPEPGTFMTFGCAAFLAFRRRRKGKS